MSVLVKEGTNDSETNGLSGSDKGGRKSPDQFSNSSATLTRVKPILSRSHQ